jgi:hypothetical protein
VSYFTGGAGLGITGVFQKAAIDSLITGSISGAITGNFDVEDILKGALLAGSSAFVSDFLTTRFNLGTGLGLSNSSPFANDIRLNFTPQAIVDRLGDRIISAGVSNVFNGQPFFSGVDNLGRTFLVTEVLAVAQFGIGELGNGQNGQWEGSLGHILLHGGAGCIAIELLDGNCASGFFAGVSQGVLAGSNLTDAQKIQLAPLLGSIAGFLWADGEAIGVTFGGTIAQSGLENNYLTHAQRQEWEDMLGLLQRCVSEGRNCQPIIDQMNALGRRLQQDSLNNTVAMYEACGNGNVAACRQHLSEAQGFQDWRYDGFFNQTSFFDVTATSVDITGSTPVDRLDWGRNLDNLALEVFQEYLDGRISLSTANARIFNDIVTFDGNMNLLVGGTTVIAGGFTVAVGCTASGILPCVIAGLGGGAAIVGSADETIDGAVTLVFGRAVVNPYEMLGQFAGLNATQSNELRRLIDQGAMIVELAAGGFAILKGGAVLGTIDTAGALSPRVVPLTFETSASSVTISGVRAIDRAQTYENGIRGIYSGLTFSERQFTAIVNGVRINGVADDVTTIGGRLTAVEAKYVSNWPDSISNPSSWAGGQPWGLAEQNRMIAQAQAYSAGFPGGVVYHTNSVELATHYTTVFQNAGIDNVQFIITAIQ